MTRQKAILMLVALALAIAAVGTFALLPKRYRVGEHLTQTTAIWDDTEAFLFLSINTEGRATNTLQEKLTGSIRHGYLALLMGRDSFRFRWSAVAYHLRSSGTVDRFDLPEGTGVYGSWSLHDGRLEFTPSENARSHIGDSGLPLRWDGERFVTLRSPAGERKAARPAGGDLGAGDSSDDYGSEGFFSPEEHRVKKAGWHRRTLVWTKPEDGESALPINLGTETFTLTLRSLPLPKNLAPFDTLSSGPKDLRLSGVALGQDKELWQQTGWKQVTKSEFQRLPAISLAPHTATGWAWLTALAALLFWRFGQWIWTLFHVATMKRATLSKMPTTCSLPPAMPAQFPLLDSANLDRYTAEFEAMGFTRLLDFSLMGNTSSHTPNFCRLLVHTGHHCFAEMFQFFPPGGMPRALRCSIQGCLLDGWYIDFTDSKPKAESSFFQMRQTIRVNMPEASTAELLREFLKMREQVCLDLGISPERDDTLEAYIRKLQRATAAMRETVKERNYAVGLFKVYFRKLSLLKTRDEYVWLGDYPKEAERRKQGYVMAMPSGLPPR